MEWSLSREARNGPTTKQIPGLLCNLKVHYHSQNKLSTDHFPSQLNQVHEPTTYFSTFFFNIFFPIYPWISQEDASIQSLDKTLLRIFLSLSCMLHDLPNIALRLFKCLISVWPVKAGRIQIDIVKCNLTSGVRTESTVLWLTVSIRTPMTPPLSHISTGCVYQSKCKQEIYAK